MSLPLEIIRILFKKLKFSFHRISQAVQTKNEEVAKLRQQYDAALKRADHLAGLLEEQRKLMKK